MNRLSFLAFYRSLLRDKLYAALNVGGLAFAIATFITLSLYVRFETSYERWLPGHAKIYLLQTKFDLADTRFSSAYPYTMSGLLELLSQEFPGLQGTRVAPFDASVVRGNAATSEKLAQVDPQFFKIFPLKILEGGGGNLLDDPQNIIISRSVARKYFPDASAVGQSLSVRVQGRTTAYRVAAVAENLPRNTELDFTMLTRLPIPTNDPTWYRWGGASLYTYLKFDTEEDARRFGAKMPSFIAHRAAHDLGPSPERTLKLPLQPLDAIHLAAPGRLATVTTLGVVGLLTLLIAVVNYVNLATARSGARAREVAMRKVLGATRGNLVRQFISEALLTVAIAACAGLAVTELALPFINAAAGTSLSIPYLIVFPALILLVALVGGLAGFYPAFLLSRYPAVSVLASARAPGGGRSGRRVRETLVIFQFALATAFIVGTMVLFAQTRHVRNADLGFARESLLVIPSYRDEALDQSQRAAIGLAVAKVPGIRAVTVADGAPGDEMVQAYTQLSLANRPDKVVSIQHVTVGDNFFQTIGARLHAGREFDRMYHLDDAAGLSAAEARNIVVNRRAVADWGFVTPDKAIGKVVREGAASLTIIGVVDDIRFYSPRKAMGPAFYEYRSHDLANGMLILKAEGDPRLTAEAVRATWHSVAPAVPVDVKTADQSLQIYYDGDNRVARLFGLGSGLAVLIGCVGLWGLASYSTALRVKEIGIRKTLGATSTDIIKLLVGQFLRPVLVANIFAWPISFVALRLWLSGFDDRIELSFLYFIAASFLATLIAILTVFSQALRASRATPAWALHHE